MPCPRPPFLSREVTRHGRPVWYVRRSGKQIRLRGGIRHTRIRGRISSRAGVLTEATKGRPAAGTLAWLVERYRETGDWLRLSLATKRQRENILKQVLSSAGDKPVAQITTDTIAAGRDRRIKTPFQARHFLDTMRGLFRWAAKAKLVKADPTAGVEDPVMPKTEGFPVWTEEHVAAYEKCWPIGTRQRVWLDVLLYTGLRRGDAVRFGSQHVRNGVGTIKTEKTGTEVTLPILPVLAQTLAAGPTGDLSFIASKNGQPFTKESFGNAFKDACRVARVPGSAHGLRKIAATTRRECWRYRRAARSHLWMVWRTHGIALHTRC